MIARARRAVAVLAVLLPPAVTAPAPAREAAPGPASGELAPTGPPADRATVDTGAGCVIDLRQSYAVHGTLSGSAEMDYRILVDGPCGSPPGTFDEEWIAWGSFDGTLDGAPASGGLVYTARVKAGGDVDGRIVLGRGLTGELRVTGNFADGHLAYEGEVR